MDLNALYRKFVLTIAANKAVTNAAQKYGMRLGASRFVAGETLDEALRKVKDLNDRGIMVTLDQLGEGVFEESMARDMARGIVTMLEGIARAGVNSNISLKLTQLGLSFNPSLAAENVTMIVARAKELGNFVRIDMEDTPYTDKTLKIFYDLRSAGFDNVGIVIQAYLYRSEKDLDDLNKIGTNVRLVKGAYKEPPDLAFPQKADVDENFRKLARKQLLGGHYIGIATHDEAIINWAKQLVQEHQIDRSKFEFQMLYGVRQGLQEQLAKEGYQVRCYVPFGRMWYPYFSRRIAESPQNFWFVAKNLFKS